MGSGFLVKFLGASRVGFGLGVSDVGSWVDGPSGLYRLYSGHITLCAWSPVHAERTFGHHVIGFTNAVWYIFL